MDRQASLYALFRRCLAANYRHTPMGGDYALAYDHRHRRLYVLFEWSNGAEDWHNNLTFFSKTANPKDPKAEQWRCHRGFLKVWSAMKDEIHALASEYVHHGRAKEISCVGYSHGAALALLATEHFSHHTSVSVTGYGFGCPRVIKGNLPDCLERRLAHFITIRNASDLVTHLPPAIFGFRHINLTVVGEKGKYSCIEAHTPQAYLEALRPIKDSSVPHPSYAYGPSADAMKDQNLKEMLPEFAKNINNLASSS